MLRRRNRRWRTAVLAAGLLLMATPAWAEGLSAVVDRAQAAIGEQMTLNITVDGSRSAEPTLPDLAAFEIHGRSHSTQVQIINGHMSSRVSYSYALLPKRAGTFTIGAARVEIDGKTYQSTPITVTITAAPAGEAAGNGPLYTTAEVSNPNPYVGEQVVYTWRFYSRARTTNLSLSMPDFEGFMAQNLGDKRDFETMVRGQQYHVIEIRKVLFPQEPSHTVLPPTSLQCDVFVNNRRGQDDVFSSPLDDFFDRGQRQTRVLRTAPIELKVQALPPPPAGFTGLVGNFQINAQISQTVLQVGDSATLTLTINGNGNVQHVQEPALKLPGFKVYDDKPVSQTNVQGSLLMGTKVFKKALVPTQAGEFAVPPVTLSYFDPQTRSYKISTTQGFNLHVSGGTAAQDPKGPSAGVAALGAPAGKQDVQLLGDDILPIYTRLDALDDQRFRPTHAALWTLLFAAPPLLFGAFAVWQRRREGLGALQAGRRRRTALRRSLRVVPEVQAGLKKGQVQQAAQLASHTVRDYLGAKLGVEGRAMTPAEARAQLEARGTQTVLAAEVEEYLGRCEAAQYGTVPGAQSVFAALADDLQRLLTKLDKSLRI